ncbi:MAG: YggS family pyridoxal phosphate-dependent enzyme [Deltaproteobacteria bacterium]|nr:YggS family pyridoxal phosphate-dependent enzyme [Deltaproteobacteria bacterium]
MLSPPLTPLAVENRLSQVLRDIATAAKAVKRDPAEITLVAVSKTFPLDLIKSFYAAGQTVFGENYLKEATEKIPLLPEATWRFIGHLQTNKAKLLPGLFSSLDTLDSLALAAKLNLALTEKGLTLPTLIQINVANETTKSGLDPKDLPAFLDQMTAFPALELKGFMTMPPYDPDPEASRPYFRRLYELREKEAPELKELSMGMSGDFPVAIAEGATLVRVGTALFGDR